MEVKRLELKVELSMQRQVICLLLKLMFGLLLYFSLNFLHVLLSFFFI